MSRALQSSLFAVLAVSLLFGGSVGRCEPADIVAINAEAILIPSREVTLSLPDEAVLRQMNVREGDIVKKGEVLAILYSQGEILARDRAVKQRELSEFNLHASERLRKNEIISEESARKSAFDYQTAKIEAEQAEALLVDKTLIAPFGGCVLRIFKESGETVGRTEKIIQLVDFATLYVQSYLEAKWLGLLRKGDGAQVVIPMLENRTVSAVVDFVDPIVDPGSGLFRVRLVLDNSALQIPAGVPARLVLNPSTKAPKQAASP